MIRITNTKNLSGVTISGDFYDLDQLVDAFHEISIGDMDENLSKHEISYINISLRVLGACYDIRHAAQGDREIFTESNAISDFEMNAHGKEFPKQNVYYSCNILYPEMILVVMALNDLIKLRMKKLTKNRHTLDASFNKAVIWDSTITTIRMFQSEFQKAISEVLTKTSFSRWQNVVHNRIVGVKGITLPFIDYWNIKYLNMRPDLRAAKLGTITKRFAEYYDDPVNQGYRQAIDDAMREYQCAESDLRTPELEYPEEIEW